MTATSKSDPSKSVSTGVALFPPVAVTLSPAGPIVLSAGQTIRFAQTVLNALDMEVDWSVKGQGTIDQTGLYTAPALIKGAQIVTITATSIADDTKSASVNIQLQ